MAEKVAVVGIQREEGWLYFLRGSEVWRAPNISGTGLASTSQAEKLASLNFIRDTGYLYYIDSAGDVSRAKRATGSERAKKTRRRRQAVVQKPVVLPVTRHATDSRTLVKGRHLDAYKLEHRLGKGHSAEVWKASVVREIPGIDLKPGQVVAIKIYTSALLQGFQPIRLHREFTVASEVQHPNLARVFDLMISPSRPFHTFMVMEYAEGVTLKEFITAKGHLKAIEAAHLGVQLFSALSEIHSYGAIHRDVKAANIMVSKDVNGLRVKLVDLGIVAVSSDGDLTGQSVFLGSKHSAPFEQLTGAEIDYRADIYGAGSVLYHCLTGRAMYDGTGPEGAIVKQMLSSPARLPIRKDSPASERRLVEFINDCIQIDPLNRPESAELCATSIRSIGEKFRVPRR